MVAKAPAPSTAAAPFAFITLSPASRASRSVQDLQASRWSYGLSRSWAHHRLLRPKSTGFALVV
ncbi:hypothetical protein AcV5_005480 [Taiwanofungus camphoratus]|nr:hypothetical protein AcV5_005480 [Antrodia cinnamomea]